MKLKVLVAFIIVATVAISCSKLQEKPVVDFAMKDFKVESTANCSEKDSACAIFQVQYPIFLSLDSNVRRAINDRVAYIINGSQGETKSLEQTGQDFIKDYEEFVKEMPDYEMSWYFQGMVEVMVASDTLISLQVASESFTGGAHASYTTNYVNIDPKTGTAYLLDAMLRAGYEDELNRLAEEDLYEQLGLSESDSIDAPDFPKEKFRLNENYGFRKEGIVFFFNDYEVPSFAEGPTEILIPYEKLQGWIR
jgi:hypothetical protein